ncbi:hypothetical protein SuNHUV7_03300 (plasmid) [Pseudoseohaeicola sp. NH-UV-7]
MTAFTQSRRSKKTRATTAQSPFCEFDFLAAPARSTDHAASAKSTVLPRGGKTGHSCKARQDQFGELADCVTMRTCAGAVSVEVENLHS